jgi:hypothetical protein
MSVPFRSSKRARFIKFLLRKGLPTDDKRNTINLPISTISDFISYGLMLQQTL